MSGAADGETLTAGRRALESQCGFSSEIVERGLEEDEDLGGGVQRNLFETGGELAQLVDGGGRAGGHSGERLAVSLAESRSLSPLPQIARDVRRRASGSRGAAGCVTS